MVNIKELSSFNISFNMYRILYMYLYIIIIYNSCFSVWLFFVVHSLMP